MRELTIFNYSSTPEEPLGHVRLSGGVITLTGFSAPMQAELQRGIPDHATQTRVTPEAGEAFFIGVLNRYSGGYVRAVEHSTYGSILKG